MEKKTSEAQLAAIKRYKQKNVKKFSLDFYPSDMDILEHIQAQPFKQAYVKALIRKDMESSDE